MPTHGWLAWRGRAAELARTPIAVVMGGDSSEREVSLTSGRAISAALRDLAGPTADVAPPVFDVEIDDAGRWVIDGAPLSPEKAVGALPPETVYLLALHGGAGEDGRVQAFLQVTGRRHTGASPQSSALCMDKHRSRLIAADAGVRVAPAAFATASGFRRDRGAALERFAAVPGRVKFVKHCSAGSSFGVHRCGSDDEVASAADSIVESGGDVLVEAAVVGLETTAGLIGDGADAAALPIVEIVPEGGTFFDHQQKYAAEGGATETCPPVLLPREIQERIQDRARRAWDAFGGTGYGRIDFIVPYPDEAGPQSPRMFDPDAEPVMLEANTLPGFTPRSLLPLSANAAGIGFRELCVEVAARALR